MHQITPLRWLAIALATFVLLSLLALWSWGRFARAARGPATSALPVAAADTRLDRAVQPLLDVQGTAMSAAALVADPLDAFIARVHLALAAERSLDIQYYIWRQDLSGHLLARELVQAADRGVRVRLLLDDLNAAGADDALQALASHPGIEVRLFNPARNRARGLRRALEMGLRFVGFNRRMHNKAWIADNRLALVGGRNVGDEYFGAADTNFRDTDLLLLGPAVAQTSAIFDAFWNSAAVVPLDALHAPGSDGAAQRELAARQRQWLLDASGSPWLLALEERRQWLAQRLQAGGHALHWSDRIRVLSDPPEKASPVASRRERAQWLLYDVTALLFSAEHESWIVSPYFVSGASGNLLLAGQARRGVDVRVLTNSLAANDVPTVHAGYAKYRADLLRDGVRLYELRPSHADTPRRIAGSSGASLHSKVILIDDRRGFVGSFNFDPRSVQLNTEMGVLFDQPGLAAELRGFIAQSITPAVAWHVTLAKDGALRWNGAGSDSWRQEPETSFGLRLFTRLLGLLPIESQL